MCVYVCMCRYPSEGEEESEKECGLSNLCVGATYDPCGLDLYKPLQRCYVGFQAIVPDLNNMSGKQLEMFWNYPRMLERRIVRKFVAFDAEGKMVTERKGSSLITGWNHTRTYETVLDRRVPTSPSIPPSIPPSILGHTPLLGSAPASMSAATPIPTSVSTSAPVPLLGTANARLMVNFDGQVPPTSINILHEDRPCFFAFYLESDKDNTDTIELLSMTVDT